MLTLKVVKSDPKIIILVLLPRFRSKSTIHTVTQFVVGVKAWQKILLDSVMND